jgi:hypothetical protein
MNDLRARCAAWMREYAWRQHSSVTDKLVEFVVAEIGRSAAGGVLDASYPAVAYFATPEDRDEFVKAICEANPNIRAKAVL